MTILTRPLDQTERDALAELFILFADAGAKFDAGKSPAWLTWTMRIRKWQCKTWAATARWNALLLGLAMPNLHKLEMPENLHQISRNSKPSLMSVNR